MKRFHWKDYWALIPVALFCLAAAAVYLLAGEHAQIAVADNLDLFQSQYQMLRITGTFYAQEASALFLNGISRDVLPTEYSLTSLLYQIFEPLLAYELLYYVKIAISIVSFVLLAGELDRCGALSGRSQAKERMTQGREPAASGVRRAAGKSGSVGSVAVPGQADRSDSVAVPGQTGPADMGPVRGQDGFVSGRGRRRQIRWNLSVLCGLAYGALNLFPSFGICYASIPLFVWLILRLERETNMKRCLIWLLAILVYPWLSYFSYFGFFLIAYLCGAFVFKSIWDSVCGKNAVGGGRRCGRGFHPDLRLLLAVIALSAGSILCEYRLFAQMLFTDEVTIRETMVQSSLTTGQILQWIADVLVNGVDMHCESVHRWLVLPVCVIYFIVLNTGYVRRGELSRVGTDLFNLAAFTAVFNAVIYGLYYSEAVRTLVETILPPLKGFQFNRTAYFNPFLWYGMFFLALYRMILWMEERGGAVNSEESRDDSTIKPGAGAVNHEKSVNGAVLDDRKNVDCFGQAARRGETSWMFRLLPWGMALAAAGIIVLSDTTYNDLLHTAKADVKRVLGMDPGNDLDYAEFYSADLFESILEDIDYDGEKSVAYGLHPAVLNYSGIATLDGYLGFYSQEYKEAFREVIAPALEENEATRIYYDEWGARCYLYSGHNTTVVEPVRSYMHTEDTIDIDSEALRQLGCRYIFSRIHITNAAEKELTLIGTYTDESSPYTIYLYALE